MREWSIDLHIHTILSPCGSEEMIPPLVLNRVRDLGIDVIAITDHNTVKNVLPFQELGGVLGIKVIPGMEVQTREDVHLICLFDNLEQASKWQDVVYEQLPPAKNKAGSFGEQWLVDQDGETLSQEDRLLLAGTKISVEEVVRNVHELGGMCIAAHIDRQAFSIWGHLGYIPGDLDLDGIELTPHLRRSPQQLREIERMGIKYVVSSDAHYLNSIKPPQSFAFMEEPSVREIGRALKGQQGRYIRTLR